MAGKNAVQKAREAKRRAAELAAQEQVPAGTSAQASTSSATFAPADDGEKPASPVREPPAKALPSEPMDLDETQETRLAELWRLAACRALQAP